jgi:hypothetical protein
MNFSRGEIYIFQTAATAVVETLTHGGRPAIMLPIVDEDVLAVMPGHFFCSTIFEKNEDYLCPPIAAPCD